LVAAEHPERVARPGLPTCDAYANFPPRRFRYLQWAARVPGGLKVIAESTRFKVVWKSPLAFGALAKHALDPEVVDGYSRGLRVDRGVRRDAAKALRGLSPRYTLAAAETLRAFTQPVLIVWS